MFVNYKGWLFFAIFLFGTGLILGLATPTGIESLLAKDIAALEEFAGLLAPLPQSAIFAVILVKNISAVLMSFAFSPFFCLVPVIALVSEDVLETFEDEPDFDDFIIGPYGTAEALLRISRILHKHKKATSDEVIAVNGLQLDLVSCEVSVDNRIVDLTFKEFELLKLLATNRGRVFTRDNLLDKIWGYDYFGGDRTVDVHIRRLRSKIEDANHSYIETVRNIGYKFIKDLHSS